MLKRTISVIITLLGITIISLGQSQQMPASDSDLSKLSDQELVARFEYKAGVGVPRVSVEIFRRGERMIEHLMTLKGNNDLYWVGCLGDPSAASGFTVISGIEGSRVTKQVAALYLISAIFYDNLSFANVPYLSDKSQDRRTGSRAYDYNTSKRLKRAWKATEKWYRRVRTEGLDKLRTEKEFPLKSTKLYFVGTYPERKRDIAECI